MRAILFDTLHGELVEDRIFQYLSRLLSHSGAERLIVVKIAHGNILLGKEHPDTLGSMDNLANVLRI